MFSSSFLKKVNQDWQTFLEARERKDKISKKVMNQELQARIEQLKRLEGREHQDYSEALLWLVFENDLAIPVMNPDLWTELFPYVKQGYEELKMPYVLWLYYAFSF